MAATAPVLVGLEPRGIFPSMSMADYHGAPGWGSSSLKAMRRGPPARVIWERSAPHKDTDATMLGTAVHSRVLTPDQFVRTYVTKPEGMSFASKEGKSWRDAMAGFTILPWDLSNAVSGIAAALKDHPLASEVLTSPDATEESMFWVQEGTLCKGRPDLRRKHYIYDLKVSRHAEGRSLVYRAYVEGWMHQLAHYQTGCLANGLDIRGGRLIVVAPTPPHWVYCLEVKAEALALLGLENEATLRAMHECEVAGNWPGTPHTWQLIDPPADAIVEFGEMAFDPAVSAEEGAF